MLGNIEECFRLKNNLTEAESSPPLQQCHELQVTEVRTRSSASGNILDCRERPVLRKGHSHYLIPLIFSLLLMSLIYIFKYWEYCIMAREIVKLPLSMSL